MQTQAGNRKTQKHADMETWKSGKIRKNRRKERKEVKTMGKEKEKDGTPYAVETICLTRMYGSRAAVRNM